MFTPWILLLISTVSSHVIDTNTNITTLYPVSNKTIIRNDIHTKLSDTETKPSDLKVKLNYTEARQNDTNIQASDTVTSSNKTDSKTRSSPQSWNIEASFGESNITEHESNASDSKEGKDKKELLKDFKPSQHLGSFFDEDSAEVIRKPIYGPVGKRPASGFVSSPKDHQEYHHHATYNKIPKEMYYTHKEFPYKFEDTIYTKTKEGWLDSIDSKPTVEVPVKVPAGGLYKLPEAFKEKPHSEEFGLDINEDGKEHAVQKRMNPWQNLLRLVTAFIPVGLIISALTPSVITIQNVEDTTQPSSLPYRRSDPGVSDMAPISERCRRRLLCELRSERHYVPPSTIPRRSMKHCYKIQCEDTEALWRMLRWLFTYNQEAGDQRARHIT